MSEFILQPVELVMDQPQTGQILKNMKSMQVGAGGNQFNADIQGIWLGAEKFADAPFSVNMGGDVIANSIKINGLSGATLAGAINGYGQLITTTLNTQTKQILDGFTFGPSGSISIASDADNGLWISPSGILGKKAGSTTFAIDNAGNATFKGNIIASTISGGSITGATIKATGGVGSDVWLASDDGSLRFYYGGGQYASILADSYGNTIYSARNNHQFFDFSGNQLAVIQNSGSANLYLGVGGILVNASGTNIGWNTGRRIYDKSWGIGCDGTFMPSGDRSANCGDSSRRWDTVVSKYLNTGDIIFSDTHCPICEQEFQEGDMLVNFTRMKDTSNPDMPKIYTIPVHVDCVKDYKKANHKKHADFAAAKEAILEAKHKALADAEDIKEKDYIEKSKAETKAKFDKEKIIKTK